MTFVTGNLSMIDLFAGCGGMTAGFVANGFSSKLAVESDLSAAATYAANFGEEETFYGDSAALTTPAIPRVDVVIGGPPCQGFSNLGSKDINDPRNQLWREYVRVVTAANPKVFVIENVDRFMKSNEFQLLLDEVEHGALAGYELSYGHLNAADFGASQRRIRTIIIASRVGRIDLPNPTHARDARDGLLPWMGTRERIAGLPEIPATTFLPDSSCEVFGAVVPGRFKGLDIHIGEIGG